MSITRTSQKPCNAGVHKNDRKHGRQLDKCFVAAVFAPVLSYRHNKHCKLENSVNFCHLYFYTCCLL